MLLANSDQVSKVEPTSGLINAVAGRLSTLEGGQAAIIDALVERIGGVETYTRVTQVTESYDGVDVQFNGRHPP